MACEQNSCSHINQVIDEHEGTYICLDCSFVISEYFHQDQNYEHSKTDKWNDNETLEYLSRLNLPDGLKHHISNIDLTNKNISRATAVYLKSNKLDSVVTLKEISSISGVSPKQIAKNETNILNKKHLLDKYCKLLDIKFSDYTVIKEKLKLSEISGHNPLTVVASYIYQHSKENNLKLSMKKISNVFGISPISIQRYLKK
jgi:transcription initiation factor TFIIIB Brf1 subunit/transcription initiation factor TFIIB